MNDNQSLGCLYSWPVIILLLLFFWPVGLYLLFKRLSYNKGAPNSKAHPRSQQKSCDSSTQEPSHSTHQAHAVCPNCGGMWRKSNSHGGYEEWLCEQCGHITIIKSQNQTKQAFELRKFSDEIIALVHRPRAKNKKHKISEWQAWLRESNCNFEDYIGRYAGDLADDSLFAITYAAYLTYGFQAYKVKGRESTRSKVEILYKIAKKDKASKSIQELISMYEKQLRNKVKKKKYCLIFIGIPTLLIAMFIILGLLLQIN